MILTGLVELGMEESDSEMFGALGDAYVVISMRPTVHLGHNNIAIPPPFRGSGHSVLFGCPRMVNLYDQNDKARLPTWEVEIQNFNLSYQFGIVQVEIFN